MAVFEHGGQNSNGLLLDGNLTGGIRRLGNWVDGNLNRGIDKNIDTIFGAVIGFGARHIRGVRESWVNDLEQWTRENGWGDESNQRITSVFVKSLAEGDQEDVEYRLNNAFWEYRFMKYGPNKGLEVTKTENLKGV